MATQIAGGDSAAASEGRLKLLLKNTFPENRDIPPIDPDGWIRVSSVSGICAREEVICSVEDLIREDQVSADLGVIFKHGHALHASLQNDVLGPAGVLLGAWRCTFCGEAWGELEFREGLLADAADDCLSVMPKACTACGEKEFKYEEIHVFDSGGSKLCGHPDGFLRLPGVPTIGVLEIKTISPRSAWEVRGCPKLDHVIQLQAYMYLTGFRWGKILYWDKGGSGMSSFIEHTIEYDEDAVDSILALVEQVREGIRTGVLPERICQTIDCPRASECAVAEICFKGVDDFEAVS